MSAVDTVELEVRELVRRRGLDPVSDRTAVRRLVDEVVADYDERSLTSELPPFRAVAAPSRRSDCRRNLGQRSTDCRVAMGGAS